MTEQMIFLAEASAQNAEGATNPLQAFFQSGAAFPIALLIMFYFALIRPQQQQKKKLQAQLAQMKKGDKVITNGGLHGVVNHKGDSTVSIKVSEGVFLTFESANISTVIPAGSVEVEEKG